KLSGGDGNDMLYGGLGNDRLTGGAGEDGFVFNSELDQRTNVDRITDFSVADDTIYLSRSVFNESLAGPLASGAFHEGTAAADADDRIIYDSATGNIYYDADGSGAGASVLFAQVTAGTALTNVDFVYI
ncbi:MAG: calcium-binding protein, partial [Sphingomonas sp.]|nr:calcium-binding protein [Sphingomonas sp.]